MTDAAQLPAIASGLHGGPMAWLAIGSLAAALIYGTVFMGRPPSATRTALKTLPVAVLAAISFFGHAPPLLTLGLAVSALGDAFLAGDPKRWLPYGLAGFLVAHLCYIALFSLYGSWSTEPIGLAGVGIVVVVAVAMLAWLWRDLGPLTIPVILYVAAIAGMVAASLMLPTARWPAVAGALAFFASDALLSMQLFKKRLEGPAGAQAVWWLYYAGQVGIGLAFFGRV